MCATKLAQDAVDSAPMWTGLNSSQKGQVDVFAEHSVVRHVSPLMVLLGGRFSRNTGVTAIFPKTNLVAQLHLAGPRP